MSQQYNTIPKIEARQKELRTEIYQVVASLGDKLLTDDARHRLSYELLVLERENTNLAADWVVLRQQQARQQALVQSQTTLL